MSLAVHHERCCGLDVHERTVVATVLTPEARVTRTFGTTTEAVLDLGDWLLEQGVTHVAMESTGVYWKPVYNLLELHASLTLLVVNPQHVKALPGRKTDVNDATWLAQLLQHGLLRASLIPRRAQREARELVRYRTSLVGARAQEVNRIHRLLQGANLKLSSVVSDITGVSGRAILAALAAGETDPERLAALGEGRLRTPRPQRAAALRGTMGPHQQRVLQSQLAHLAFLDAEIAGLSAEIVARLAPHSDSLARLDTIPGVGLTTAEVIVTELGTDMTAFPSAQHAASWAGLSPGQHESGGTRHAARTRKGNRMLRATLTEAARAAAKTPTALGRQYQRLARRIGPHKAAFAIARKILVLAYCLLRDGTIYQDPVVPTELPPHIQQRRRHRALRELHALGFAVTLSPLSAVS
jgi:transposase